MTTCADLLTDVLRERGFTKTIAARLLGCSIVHVSDLARGAKRPSPRMAVKLERAFGIEARTWLLAVLEEDLAEAYRLEAEVDRHGSRGAPWE